MYRGGRPLDPSFLPEELLYHRFKSYGYDEEPAGTAPELLVLEAMRFPNTSVNRQKYSHEYDCLFPTWCGEGVVSFPAGKVPQRLEVPPKKANQLPQSVFTFFVEHDPCPANYGHTEIRVAKNSFRLTNDEKVPSSIKSKFKQDLSNSAKILRLPSPSERLPWLWRRVESWR